jgi:hypothetical protein
VHLNRTAKIQTQLHAPCGWFGAITIAENEFCVGSNDRPEWSEDEMLRDAETMDRCHLEDECGHFQGNSVIISRPFLLLSSSWPT